MFVKKTLNMSKSLKNAIIISMQSQKAMFQAIKFDLTVNKSKSSKIINRKLNSLDLFEYFT